MSDIMIQNNIIRLLQSKNPEDFQVAMELAKEFEDSEWYKNNYLPTLKKSWQWYTGYGRGAATVLQFDMWKLFKTFMDDSR